MCRSHRMLKTFGQIQNCIFQVSHLNQFFWDIILEQRFNFRHFWLFFHLMWPRFLEWFLWNWIDSDNAAFLTWRLSGNRLKGAKSGRRGHKDTYIKRAYGDTRHGRQASWLDRFLLLWRRVEARRWAMIQNCTRPLEVQLQLVPPPNCRVMFRNRTFM